MTAEYRRWVIDTSTYTHLCRAGHASLLEQLAPGGVVVVPTEVNDEIERGRERYPGIRAATDVDWAELAVLTEEEQWTVLKVKAELSGGPLQHLGECAVIACAHHRGFTAVLDDRSAILQAEALGVRSVDTLWIVVEAFKTIFDRSREQAAQVVDDLVATDMRLPIKDGASLFAWAYEQELLP
jgi:predicted nucleic acid-binding protein